MKFLFQTGVMNVVYGSKKSFPIGKKNLWYRVPAYTKAQGDKYHIWYTNSTVINITGQKLNKKDKSDYNRFGGNTYQVYIRGQEIYTGSQTNARYGNEFGNVRKWTGDIVLSFKRNAMKLQDAVKGGYVEISVQDEMLNVNGTFPNILISENEIVNKAKTKKLAETPDDVNPGKAFNLMVNNQIVPFDKQSVILSH